VKPAFGCFVLFLLPFCGVGIFMAVNTLRAATAGQWAEAPFFLVFALAFGGIGFGLLGVALRGRARAAEVERLKAEHPDQPWLWRPDWAAGRIEGSSRRSMFAVWGFALLWNVITAGVVPPVVIQEYVEKRNRLALLALVFPAVGIGLLIWAVRLTLRYRKFGVSIFRVAQVPGVTGRKLYGVILTNTYVRPDDGFGLTPNCVNRVTTRSGGESSTRERILWQEERQVTETGHVGRTATAIPVSFRLPLNARETDASDPSSEILWRLEARASVPGVEYHAGFEVPVFRTPASEIPLPPEEEEPLAEYTAEYRQPPDSRIYVTSGLRRTEIFFAPARAPATRRADRLPCLLRRVRPAASLRADQSLARHHPRHPHVGGHRDLPWAPGPRSHPQDPSSRHRRHRAEDRDALRQHGVL